MKRDHRKHVLKQEVLQKVICKNDNNNTNFIQEIRHYQSWYNSAFFSPEVFYFSSIRGNKSSLTQFLNFRIKILRSSFATCCFVKTETTGHSAIHKVCLADWAKNSGNLFTVQRAVLLGSNSLVCVSIRRGRQVQLHDHLKLRLVAAVFERRIVVMATEHVGLVV